MAVGASAGGIEAAQDLFSRLPSSAAMAYVLILHLDPTRESIVDRVIRTRTSLAVVPATDGMRLEPGRVHVAPPGFLLDLDQGALKLSRPKPSQTERHPIDHFLQSLAAEMREGAVCIILSGSGTDGAIGARQIGAGGGVVIVQDPANVRFDGMPQGAIATGAADYVLPIAEMPRVLMRIARTRHGEKFRGDDAARLSGLLGLVRSRLGFNFGAYKPRTLLRRVRRRMELMKLRTIGEYVAALRDNAEEVQALSRDFLIGVTDFFREPEAWAMLEKEVIHPLVRRAVPGQPIRVWVAGCATGEEAYGVAMLFLDQINASKRAIGLQVFASDVSEEALATARAGRYPRRIEGRMPPGRLRRYFTGVADGHHWQVRKELRDVVVFAAQNLFADPPYSHMDLICCRNLLIYLEPDVQDRILSLFHFALDPEAFLFLGPAESAGQNDARFRAVSKKWRIFRRVAGPDRIVVPAVAHHPARPHPELPAGVSRPVRENRLAALAQQILLDRFAPAAVLVNARNETLHLSGRTELYLRHPRGAPTLDVLLLVREGLSAKLRSVLRSVTARGAPVQLKNIRVQRAGKFVPVRITVLPVASPVDGEAPLRLVVFEEDRQPSAPRAKRSPDRDGDIVRQLESELLIARGDLKSSLDQLDSSNEDFRAANEEVMSINEELQATNEELETSREELQSLNEELSTVNSQLQSKVGELEQTNNDLSNLLASTDIATLCLDREDRIKWFTPPTTTLLRLLPGDRGRSIRDFASRFHDGELLEDVDKVTRTLVPAERTVQSDDGRWFTQRVLPYRTEEDRIDGVVITFVDVTKARNAETALQALNEDLERRVEDRTRIVKMQQQAAAIANESRTLEEALEETLALVCRHHGWVLGHSLLAEVEDAGLFSDSGVWWRAPVFDNRSFERAVRGSTYRAGSDPVGRVIATGELLWLPDLAQAGPSAWTEAALAAGLRSALILPIRVERRTVGLFKLFSSEVTELGEPWIEALKEVGTQLGRAVERSRFEARVTNFADTERAQIAQELHDVIGQGLVGAGMIAASLKKELEAGGRPVQKLSELIRSLDATREDVRVLSRGLVPVEVDADGLVGALEDLAVRSRRLPELECQLIHTSSVPVHDNTTATQLFRIAQEAVRNAIEHGRPHHITITLEDGQRLALTVHDDGVGLLSGFEEGIGIRLMRQRATLIGARLHISSVPGEGTVVTCALLRAPMRI